MGIKFSSSKKKPLLMQAVMFVHDSPTLIIGLMILIGWIIVALTWPMIVPYNPLRPDISMELQPPGILHWFGTDIYGRDVLSRILAGSRNTILIAFLATALGLAIGVITGLMTGYFQGVLDDIIMRAIDALMAFPLIVLALLALVILGSSQWNVILVIGVAFAPLITRTVRSVVLTERDKEYVKAAQLQGENSFYIMLREILPNVTGPILVEGTIRLGYAVFTSATLGFLGLGAQPPTPDWGLMINGQMSVMLIAPWTVLFPSLAIALLVIAVGMVADGLQERR